MQTLIQDAVAGYHAVVVPVCATPLTYLPPRGYGRAIEPGQIVEVPLGAATSIGVVWGAAAPREDVRYRPMLRVYDWPLLPTKLRVFLDLLGTYYMSGLGAACGLALRPLRSMLALQPAQAFRIAPACDPAGLTPLQRRALPILLKEPSWPSLRAMSEAAGVSTSTLRVMQERGAIEKCADAHMPQLCSSSSMAVKPELSPAQKTAAAEICAQVESGGYSAHLLQGVTGSGKTLVYVQAIAAALRTPGAQVLLLLPEIALGESLMRAVTGHFPIQAAFWHSRLTPSQRRAVWRGVAAGSVRLVVGARSALFLPFADLRMVVVDEEHDPGYKQDDHVRYHARDMAVARARRDAFPVLLVSATPSLESLHKAFTGLYSHKMLEKRVGGAQLPQLASIDMRRDKPPQGSYLSSPLRAAVEHCFSMGEQAFLYVNRRGYAPYCLCSACGHLMRAPDTDSLLTYHREARILLCHITGFRMKKPARCPACGRPDTLESRGAGVERIAEEAIRLWPQRSVGILSSDKAWTCEKGKVAPRELIESMARGDIDILVATQIAAKGYHFPLLTLVGVIEADMGMSGADLRVGERTYQLLEQVTGRSGRAQRPGRGLLQCHEPEHAVIAALLERDTRRLVALELEGRKAMGFPPYGRLAALIASCSDEALLRSYVLDLAKAAPRAAHVSVMGPVKAPIYRLRGAFRYRFLVKAQQRFPLQAYISDWLEAVEKPWRIKQAIDIDPYNFA